MSIPDLLRAAVVIVAAYLVGSIPWGVIVARAAGGPDPRSLGSGRTGGSNMMRAVGPRLALVSGLLDAAKGSVAVLIAYALGAGALVAVLAAFLSIVGHSRSIFLGFGGGRGVAPAFGALLVISPLVTIAILPIFIGVIAISKYSSLGSLSASAASAVFLIIQVAVTGMDPWYYTYGVGGAALIWIFHKDNIGRLLAGTERKIGTPKVREAVPPVSGERGQGPA